MKAAIVFSANGPILVLTSCPAIDTPLFSEGMRAKGIRKFIAYEVDIDRCQQLYRKYFRLVSAKLGQQCALDVLDFDGHRVLLNFSLRELGRPVIVDEERAAA